MNVLHTSDWHIGRRLFNKELDQDHLLFFDWIIDTINNEKIDLLLIAGDIFDLAFPSNVSLQMYYRFLVRLQTTCCKHVVITGGNHDSPGTLNAPKQILEFLNVHIIGGATENIYDEIIKITTDNGDTQLVICAVPFLRDRDVRQSVAGESFADRAVAIREGIVKHYQLIAEKVQEYKDTDIPVIATAHLFVADSDMEQAERDLYIGGLQQINSSAFSDIFDYVALGHIHRQQKIGGKENIRYSGCPFAMELLDRKQQKVVIKINFSDKKNPVINTINVPVFRNMIQITGKLHEVVAEADKFVISAPLSAIAEIVVVEEKYDPSIHLQFEKFLEQVKNMEVLNHKIVFNDKISGADSLFYENVSLKEIGETEVFNRLIEQQNPDNADELKDAFFELLNQVKNN